MVSEDNNRIGGPSVRIWLTADVGSFSVHESERLIDFFPFIVRTQYKLEHESGLVGDDIGYSLVVVSRTSIQLSSDLRLCGCEGSWQVSA